MSATEKPEQSKKMRDNFYFVAFDRKNYPRPGYFMSFYHFMLSATQVGMVLNMAFYVT